MCVCVCLDVLSDCAFVDELFKTQEISSKYSFSFHLDTPVQICEQQDQITVDWRELQIKKIHEF